MTQKRVQISAYAILLMLGVSTAWAEVKKENSQVIVPAPKCCNVQPGSPTSGCCAADGSCPCCAKKIAADDSGCEDETTSLLTVKAYPVAKLLWPLEPLIVPVGNQELLFLGWIPRLQDDSPEDELVRLIRNTVAPTCWHDHGGEGTIDYFPSSQSVLVKQTPDVQEQVADLIAALVRLHDIICSAAPSSCIRVPPPTPVASPPPGVPFTQVPPMPQLFAERVLPPLPLAGGLVPPPLPAPGIMPPAGLWTAPAMQPLPTRKTYVLEAKLMENAPGARLSNSKVQAQPTGDLIFGYSDAGLTGTIVPREQDQSVSTRVLQIIFCPDPAFRGCCQVADMPGKEIGTWLLHVKGSQMKNGKLHLEVVSVEGKAEKTKDGKVALHMNVTPVLDRKVKIGEKVKKVLEKDEDGTFRKWLELTVKELPPAPMGAVCPPPVGAPTPAPVPTAMMPVPCLSAPMTCQPVCMGIVAEPAAAPRLAILPSPGVLPCLAALAQSEPPKLMGLMRQGDPESSWNLRPIIEEGKPRLIVREGDRDSVTLKSLVIKIPGTDPVKLTAAGTQIRARSGSLQARADKVSRRGEAGCFLFEGHVKLIYKKDGELAKVTAERVFVNLADGRIEIQNADVISPAAPLEE